MADQTVTVQFKTIAELKGAEAYLTALERSIGQTEAAALAGKKSKHEVESLRISHELLSESILESKKSLEEKTAADASANQASKEEVKATKEVAKETDYLREKKFLLRRILGQLMGQVPGFNILLRGLSRTMTATTLALTMVAGALGLGIRAFKSWMAEVAAARATAEAFRSIQVDLDNVYQSQENVREGIANISKALAAAQGPAKTASDLLQDDNKALAEAAKLTDELAEAEKQRALAQVEYRVSAGEITEDEGKRLRERIELQGKQANRQKEIERTELELQRTRKAARAEEVAGTYAGAMAKTFPADREALLLRQKNAEKALKGMEDWDKKIEEFRAKQKKYEEQAEGFKEERLAGGIMPGYEATHAALEKEARRKAEENKEKADAMARQLDQERTLKKRAEDAIRQNDEAAKEWQTAGEKSVKAAKTLGETADVLQRKLDALKAHAERMGGVEGQTAWYGEQVSKRSEAAKNAHEAMEKERRRIQEIQEAAKTRGGGLLPAEFYEMEAAKSRLKAIEETPEKQRQAKMIGTYGTGGALFTPGYTPTAGRYKWPGGWTKGPAYQLNELAGQAERMAGQPVDEQAVERLAAALANIGAMVRGSVELTRRVDAVAAQIETLYSQLRTNRGTE